MGLTGLAGFVAALLLVGLPVAVLYNFFLDRFIQGITGGVGK
jgi:ABC-type maltose transport system permease subunit